MNSGIIGRKLGMIQIFIEDGIKVPVTVIEAGPCQIIQKKSIEKEGYNAIQLGFMEKKIKRVNKPLLGHLKKAGDKAYYYIKEFRVDNIDKYQLGETITVDIFKPGDKVDISGISKGKGFAGVIKRWGFKGGPASHGSMFHRAPGSIGASSFPSRVFKGKKLPGHLGNRRVTVQNLRIIDVKKEDNIILVKGAVPGPKSGVLIIKEGVKNASS
jgi:large subunit ribosomal protein L3